MAQHRGEPRLNRRVEDRLIPVLESADAVVYGLVGLVFLAAALGMLGSSVIVFPTNIEHDGFPLAIVTLINDLLLVMIIMEVLRTVLSYLVLEAALFAHASAELGGDGAAEFGDDAMTVDGTAAELCDHAVEHGREAETEGTCGPSPVNPTCGGVLHYALRAPLRPLRR